jgi:hypothetical protein
MKSSVSCDTTPSSAFVVEPGIHQGLTTSCQDLPEGSLNLDTLKGCKSVYTNCALQKEVLTQKNFKYMFKMGIHEREIKAMEIILCRTYLNTF